MAEETKTEVEKEKAPKGVPSQIQKKDGLGQTLPPAQMASADADKVGNIKKLEEFKNNEENKKAIAESEGKVEDKETKKESKPAVAKVSKKEKTVESKVELEREYVVPLKRGVLNVPHYKRAKKAIRVLKEFIVKHAKIRDRDLRKVKIDIYLNNELWFRGIKKPANKIKVKVKKIDGIAYVELANIPEAVGYKMAWDAKQKAESVTSKVKAPAKKEEFTDKDKDGIDDKVEEKETKKAGGEMDAKMEKFEAKQTQHTAQGKHAKKTMPVRKSLKK
ncbi:MAG: hypothetical protein ABIF18_03835 [archaeon]